MRFKTSSNTPSQKGVRKRIDTRAECFQALAERTCCANGCSSSFTILIPKDSILPGVHHVHRTRGALGKKRTKSLVMGPHGPEGSISMLLKIPKQNYLPILGWFPLLTIMFGEVVARSIQFVQANWKASGQRHPDNSRNLAGLL